VVVLVGGPEQAHLVRAAVPPVVDEVLGQEEQHPGPGARTDLEDPMLVDEEKEGEGRAVHGGRDDDVAEAHLEARGRVAPLVAGELAAACAPELPVPAHLEPDQREEDRDRGVDENRHAH